MIRITFVLAASAALAAGAACSTKVNYGPGPDWPGPTDLPTIGNGKVLITNSGSDTLSWIDLDTLENVYTMPVGLLPPEREGPHHGAAAADGSVFYIGLSNYVPGSGSGPHGSHGTGAVDGYLLEYDAKTLELMAATRVSRSPGDVRLTPDGTKVLQSHYDLVRITQWAMKGGPIEDSYAPIAIVDSTTMKATLVPLCPANHGIAIAPDSSKAFVSCSQSDEVGIVDLTTTPYQVSRVPLGSMPTDPAGTPLYDPYSVAVHPTDGTVWVSNLKTGDVRVLDATTMTWVTTIDMQGVPFFGTFNAAGTLYFAAVQASNSFVVVDAFTRQVQLSLPLESEACYQPHGVLLTPDEQRALVVCEGDHIANGTVAVVNLQNPMTPTVEKVLEVGVFPDDAILLRSAP
jgi:YVTN family beta-propeller protein